jgi:hypothetical protein
VGEEPARKVWLENYITGVQCHGRYYVVLAKLILDRAMMGGAFDGPD